MKSGRDSRILYISGIVSILATMAIVLLVAIVISKCFKYLDYLDVNFIKANFIYPVEYFMPENVEKIQYVTGIMIAPISIFIINFTFIKLLKSVNDSKINKLYYVLFFFISIFSLSLVVFGLSEYNFFLYGNYLMNHQLSGILLFLISLFLIFIIELAFTDNMRRTINTIIGLALFIISVYLITVISSSVIFNRYYVSEQLIFTDSFNALFYSVAQVYQGKALLINFTNQYGLYPHFLEPIFKLIGLKVYTFTIVMAALMFTSYACILVFLYLVTKNKVIAVTGLISMIFYNYVLEETLTRNFYFQFTPLRIIFPSLILILSFMYFKLNNTKVKNLLYIASFVVSSIAILWNLETGIAVFLSWMLLLFYHDASQYDGWNIAKEIARNAINGIVILMSVFIIFSMYMFIRYGNLPNFSELVKYQFYFYQFGFFMIPMKLIHPWNLVAIVYLIGLVYAAQSLIAKNNTMTPKMVFLLSILGFGIFVYYEGRSHDLNLLKVCFPAILIIIIFTDMLFTKISIDIREKHLNLLELSVFAILFFFLIASSLSLLNTYDTFKHIGSSRNEISESASPTSVTQNIAFIKNNTISGERILILSYQSGVYYAESDTVSPLDTPGTSEIFLQKEHKKITNFLNSNETDANKVFLDVNFEKGFSDKGVDNLNITRTISNKYNIVSKSSDNTMILYSNSAQ